MQDKIFKALDDIAVVNSREDINIILPGLLGGLGVRWYSCFNMFRAGGQLSPQILFFNAEKDKWVEHYRKHKYFLEDPGVRHLNTLHQQEMRKARTIPSKGGSLLQAAHTLDWFTWQDLQDQKKLSDRGGQIFAQAYEHGLTEGLVVPMLFEDWSMSAFSVAGHEMNLSDRGYAGIFATLLILIHRRFVDIAPADLPAPLVREELTESQKDVLQQRAEGMTNNQIAGNLGIVRSAVTSRLARACERLGVETVEEAIAVAISGGQILPPIVDPTWSLVHSEKKRH